MKSKSFGEIKVVNERTILTGNKLFDQWFSKDGGIVPGSKIFVTGTSGAGKTTLMVNIMNWLKNHKSSFYSREMSISSLKQQIKDYEFNNPNAYFVDDEDCPNLKDYLNELDMLKPEFVIVDSLQAIASADYPEMSEEKGSILVREILTKWCKENNATLFLIGHNTKDNEFAGKNTNMQMVDAHMVLEYDKKTETRIIYWGKKNRKGPMGKLFYKINDGSIEFYNNQESPIDNSSNFEVSFSNEFEIFLKEFLNKLEKKNNSINQIRKEINRASDTIYDKFNGNKNEYMINLMSAIYKIMNKNGVN
jgi:predicted ATP-dependent serine protease